MPQTACAAAVRTCRNALGIHGWVMPFPRPMCEDLAVSQKTVPHGWDLVPTAQLVACAGYMLSFVGAAFDRDMFGSFDERWFWYGYPVLFSVLLFGGWYARRCRRSMGLPESPTASVAAVLTMVLAVPAVLGAAVSIYAYYALADFAFA
jgi:hypothetical protein